MWWTFPPLPPSWPPEVASDMLAKLGRIYYAKTCPREAAFPQQPWVTEETWQVTRRHAVLRAQFFTLKKQAVSYGLNAWFLRWRAALPHMSPLGGTMAPLALRARESASIARRRRLDSMVLALALRAAARQASQAAKQDKQQHLCCKM